MRSWRCRSSRSVRWSGRGAAGGSSVDPNTEALVDSGTSLAALTGRIFRRPASSHQQDFLFSLSRNATGCDPGQDDAAGLDAERAFYYPLLGKRMLLEVAACVQTNAASRRSHPRGLPARKPRCTCSSGRACQPHACCAYPSTAPRHAWRWTPLIRVNCADATAVAALPHACSDCACLPVMPDKPRQ